MQSFSIALTRTAWRSREGRSSCLHEKPGLLSCRRGCQATEIDYWGQCEGITAAATPTHSWTGLVVTDSRDITDAETVVSCAVFFCCAQPHVHREERCCLCLHCCVRLPRACPFLLFFICLTRSGVRRPQHSLNDALPRLYQPLGSGVSPRKNRRGENLFLTNRDAPRSITKLVYIKRIKKKRHRPSTTAKREKER